MKVYSSTIFGLIQGSRTLGLSWQLMQSRDDSEDSSRPLKLNPQPLVPLNQLSLSTSSSPGTVVKPENIYDSRLS